MRQHKTKPRRLRDIPPYIVRMEADHDAFIKRYELLCSQYGRENVTFDMMAVGILDWGVKYKRAKKVYHIKSINVHYAN